MAPPYSWLTEVIADRRLSLHSFIPVTYGFFPCGVCTCCLLDQTVEQSFFDLQTRSKALCVAGQISADDLFINNQPFSRLLVRGNQMVTEPKTHRGGRGQQRGRGQRERRQQRQIREDRLDSDGHTDRRRSSSASFSSPPSVRASSAISIAPLSTQEQDRRCHRQRSLSDSFSESTNQQRGEVAEGFLSQHDSIDLHSGEENRDEDDDMNQMMCSDSSVLSEAFRTTQHLLGVLECASFPPTSEPLPQHRDLLQLQIEEEDDARVPLLDNRFSPGRTAEAFPYFVDDAISSFGSPAHLDDLAPVAYPRVVGLSLNPATPSPPHIRNRRNRSA